MILTVEFNANDCKIRKQFKEYSRFLRATADTAVARLSHRNSVRPSVCLSVRLSVTRLDQSKAVETLAEIEHNFLCNV